MAVHNIKVCMGSSCFARGNLNNLDYIENFIKENNLDADIDLFGAHCQENVMLVQIFMLTACFIVKWMRQS